MNYLRPSNVFLIKVFSSLFLSDSKFLLVPLRRGVPVRRPAAAVACASLYPHCMQIAISLINPSGNRRDYWIMAVYPERVMDVS